MYLCRILLIELYSDKKKIENIDINLLLFNMFL